MAQEFEIKFTGIDKAEIRKKLSGIWLEIYQEEFLMKRKVFHIESSKKREWFRVRLEKERTTLTYKCIHSDWIDGIEEYEIIISDFDVASTVLVKAGLINTSTQENLREIWKNWDIEVCIDTWPWLKSYIEIEGDNPDIVRDYCNRLWFHFEDWMFWWSEVVYEKELWLDRKVFLWLPYVTFDNPPKLC